MTPPEEPPPAEPARVFVALMTGPELGGRIAADVLSALGGEEAAHRAFRLPRPEGLHLTLAFLGDLERVRLAPLAGALAAELAGAPAPRLWLEGAGAFPKRGHERVLWIGVGGEGTRELASLAERVGRAARLSGAEPERHERFHPHVTVARPRNRTRVPEAFYELALDEAWHPGSVALVESVRSPRAPSYEVREAFSLA